MATTSARLKKRALFFEPKPSAQFVQTFCQFRQSTGLQPVLRLFMNTAEVTEIQFKDEQAAGTGSARRSPKSVEQQLSGCTLTELMHRSEAVTEVLKNILQFSVPKPKDKC